jgi:hypothetical protein
MLELAQYWIAASYVIAIGLAIDQLRRPLAEWEAAGRVRRFWVPLTVIMGFHGLGEYAAVAYFVGVVPRFHGADVGVSRSTMRRAAKLGRGERRLTSTEELVLVAALLVFASSFIHSAVIADHFEEHWLIGVFFAVVTLGQAVWSVLVYGDPLSRRVLVAGAAGNLAVAIVWAISRTVGVPIGAHPWRPEPIGGADVLSTLDELAAVMLVAVALARLRGARLTLSAAHVRLAGMVAGPLFIYSLLAAFGGGHHHHFS